MGNYSYMDIYNTILQRKQMLRNSIPADQITNSTKQVWNIEDQSEALKLRYYQETERKRLSVLDTEENYIPEIKFTSEVRIKR